MAVFVAVSVMTTCVLATASSVVALLGVRSSGLWLTLFLVQPVWMYGDALAGAAVVGRRRTAPVLSGV